MRSLPVPLFFSFENPAKSSKFDQSLPYRKPRPEDQIQYMIADKQDKRAKAHVNAIFFRQLRELLRK